MSVLVLNAEDGRETPLPTPGEIKRLHGKDRIIFSMDKKYTPEELYNAP